MTNLKKQSLATLKVVLLGLLVGVGINYVSATTAWTGVPSGCTPPSCNTDAPLNVGPVNQTKAAGLAVNEFTAAGQSYFGANVGIGTQNPGAKLEIAQNSAIKLGNAYISSGANNNLAHFATNEWWNGTAWVVNGEGGLIQIQPEGIYLYHHTAASSDTSHTVLLGVQNNGGILIPANKGNGKVLTSDANGVGTWQVGAGSYNYFTSGNDTSVTPPAAGSYIVNVAGGASFTHEDAGTVRVWVGESIARSIRLYKRDSSSGGDSNSNWSFATIVNPSLTAGSNALKIDCVVLTSGTCSTYDTAWQVTKVTN